MMKKYISVILAAALMFSAMSCKKQSAGVTRITYYPTITLEGDAIIIKVGESYTDPGFSASMNGENITDKVTVTDDIDNTTPGIYHIYYSTTNEDGISSAAVRTVFVTNPGHFDNVYLSACGWNPTPTYRNLPILIEEIQSGIYLIEDLCGGFYCYGRYPGYEPTYDFHAEGYVTVGADGSLTLIDYDDWYFVGSFDYGNFSGQYDAATGIVNIDFDGMLVELTPIS